MDHQIFVLFLTIATFLRKESFAAKEQVCMGTHARFSVTSNLTVQYNLLKERFTNCTHVDGNLEITWLQNKNWDLSFLQDIEEVTGYVLIAHVKLGKVVLPRLQIIHGKMSFAMDGLVDEFALAVISNEIDSLELPALHTISKGGVALLNNPNICYLNTINWKVILMDSKVRHIFDGDSLSAKRECPPCHKKCDEGCWGEGEENCQILPKRDCTYNSLSSLNTDECCHKFCKDGCTGPDSRDCISCKYFYNNGDCTDECPPLEIYNFATYSWEKNPTGKYAHGSICFEKCPNSMLADNGTCVEICPPNKIPVNGECILNETNSKTCRGDVIVSSGNIANFNGCTTIEGSIYILQNSFDGYDQLFPNLTLKDHYDPMHPDHLEAFSNVKRITGFLNIQGYHVDFKNLSYFRNLEVIGGQSIFDFNSSLYVIKTSLESLNLRSLKKIANGTVVIAENDHLCFIDSINWETIKESSEHKNILQNNRRSGDCDAAGLVCDPKCNTDGCWGIGSDQCLSYTILL